MVKSIFVENKPVLIGICREAGGVVFLTVFIFGDCFHARGYSKDTVAGGPWRLSLIQKNYFWGRMCFDVFVSVLFTL